MIRFAKVTFIVVILIFVIPGHSLFFGKALILSPSLEKVALGYYIEYIEDKTGTLSFDELKNIRFANNWKESRKVNSGFGYTKSAFWLRLTVINPHTKAIDFFIEQGQPIIDELTLYKPMDDGYERVITGDIIEDGKRPYPHRHFVFPLTLPGNTNATYYIRQRTVSSMKFNYKLWTKDAFITHSNLAYYFLMVFYGILFILAIYNLLIFIFIHRIEYLYYTVSILSLLLTTAIVDGIAAQFLWPTLPWLSKRILNITASLTNIFYLLFIIEVLELRKNSLLLYKIGFIYSIVNCLTLLTGTLLPYKIIVIPLVFSTMGNYIIAFILSLGMVIKRNRAAYFVLTAGIFVYVGVLTFNLRNLGILPQLFITNWAIHIGSIFLVSLLALSLADRINVMRVNLSNLNDHLEEKVKNRTYELHEANEKLKQIDVLKSNFFANVSHEIRTPLTLILSPVVSALQGDYDRAIDDNFLNNIHKNAARLLRLINNILDFSKLDANKMSLKISEVNIIKLIRSCIHHIEHTAESKGIKISFLSDDNTLMMYIDREKIDKVMMNLFSNALKFTEKGGTIFVKLAHDDQYCRISVEDTGSGIPADKLKLVFDRFSQIHSGATVKHHGTGIGLSLARELILLHEGKITVNSNYIEDFPDEHGTVFSIKLPRGKEYLHGKEDVHFITGSTGDTTDDEHMAAVWEDESLSKAAYNEKAIEASQKALMESGNLYYRILIVDDNYDMLQFIKYLLKDIYYIYTAENGRQALDKAHRLEPDLIITDVMMPIMNGYELTQKIKEDKKLMQIPILMLTAKADIRYKIEGLEYGADDYLNKPFNSRELLTRVKSLLRFKEMQNELLDLNLHLSLRVQDATSDVIQREYEALELLGDAAEYRDPETGKHVERMAHYSKLIADSMNIDQEERDIIFYAAPLHDIGKVGIADSILLKPGKLTDDEFDRMKAHCKIGYEILKNKKSKYLQAAAIISLTHHERYDGTGYPAALKGDDIHIFGRITALADVFDALTSKRCYKESWPFDMAIKYIEEQRGKHFDPEVVDIFLSKIDEVKKIYTTMQEDITPE